MSEMDRFRSFSIVLLPLRVVAIRRKTLTKQTNSHYNRKTTT